MVVATTAVLSCHIKNLTSYQSGSWVANRVHLGRHNNAQGVIVGKLLPESSFLV